MTGLSPVTNRLSALKSNTFAIHPSFGQQALSNDKAPELKVLEREAKRRAEPLLKAFRKAEKARKEAEDKGDNSAWFKADKKLFKAYYAIHDAIEKPFKKKYKTWDLMASDTNFNGLVYDNLSKDEQQALITARETGGLFRDSAVYIVDRLAHELITEKSYLSMIHAN